MTTLKTHVLHKLGKIYSGLILEVASAKKTIIFYRKQLAFL